MLEVRLPMLEYDFSKQPDQGFDDTSGEHGGFEMGIRGSSKDFVMSCYIDFFKYFLL